MACLKVMPQHLAGRPDTNHRRAVRIASLVTVRSRSASDSAVAFCPLKCIASVLVIIKIVLLVMLLAMKGY